MLRINGKEYKEAEIDFNSVCELEDMGVNLMNLKKVSEIKLARAYVALCMGGAERLEVAGSEINKHIINGGDFNGILEAFGKAVKESGFFQALNKTAEERDKQSKGEENQAN